MSGQISIVAQQAEHHESGFGIGHSKPRLSWRFGETSAKDWVQTGYELSITRGLGGGGKEKEEKYAVDSNESVLVPWPSARLASREIARVTVSVTGKTPHGSTTTATSPPLIVEAGLLERDDWKGHFISGPKQDITKPKKPFTLTNTFTAQASGSAGGKQSRARLYATALGLYTVRINGQTVGDQVLAPGWQSYKHHLNYQAYDISSLLHPGDEENRVEVTVGEGWYAGRLGFGERRNHFGDRLGFLGQVEIDGKVVCATNGEWAVGGSPIVSSEIYNGETYDTTFTSSSPTSNSASNDKRGKAEVIPWTTATLIASDAPPVRRVREVKPLELITTPSGKTVIDFGQNLVGWPRIDTDLKGDGKVVIRHAEVLENGELGTRPLRGAKATTTIKLGGRTKGWEPSFTFYGFRYIEVTGAKVGLSDFTAVAIASDMRPTGTFNSSHALVNQLHKNVIWGMLSNFVSVPTDCPQRDERLGWTGDIQVFTPTANFLFDTSGFLSGWLQDLAAETIHDYNGIVPEVVPYVHLRDPKPHPHAIWADVSIITPRDLYTSFGDTQILERQFESMRAWLDKGVPRREDGGLWKQLGHQYGDWLDPKAPPAYPAHGMTDPMLAANAYLVYVTRLIAQIARTIGKSSEAKRYQADYERLLKLFRAEYVTPAGRLVSDTQTALCLALHFDLLETSQQKRMAAERLEWLIQWESFKVSTGFAGTPIILDTLAENEKLQVAYRMLQERDNPSWLYPVSMGATTIWERWDSMLPDGRINPGQMTSFNHYALGSVANFLHGVVGGLSPLGPGWRKALIKPQPGGTLTSAKVTYDSAYGPYAVEWNLEGTKLQVKASVPPNTTAQVELPGVSTTVGSGQYEWSVEWQAGEWPPKQIKGPTRAHPPDEFVP